MTEWGDQLVTTATAAAYARVATGTVRSWASRGLLEPARRDRSGQALYRLGDVASIERRTRREARGRKRSVMNDARTD